jgi:hypothetical protein
MKIYLVGKKMVLVLDEHLSCLKASLEDSGFRVITHPKGIKDPELAPFFTGKVLVTPDIEGFKINALIYDFDIINTSSIKFIDKKADRTNETAQKIANAIRNSRAHLRKGNWILTIRDNVTYFIESNV